MQLFASSLEGNSYVARFLWAGSSPAPSTPILLSTVSPPQLSNFRKFWSLGIGQLRPTLYNLGILPRVVLLRRIILGRVSLECLPRVTKDPARTRFS